MLNQATAPEDCQPVRTHPQLEVLALMHTTLSPHTNRLACHGRAILTRTLGRSLEVNRLGVVLPGGLLSPNGTTEDGYTTFVPLALGTEVERQACSHIGSGSLPLGPWRCCHGSSGQGLVPP